MKPADFLLLVKRPAKGAVKRRLASGVGEAHAAGLYRCFVEDILDTFEKASVVPVICHYPARAGPGLRRWLGPRYPYLAQRGRDHPDRLRCAFEDMFAAGSENVVIIASDNPDLPRDIIIRARKALHSSDAVLGPTADGGYCLIGFRAGALVPGAFQDIDWSTERVLGQTTERIRSAGRSIVMLPVWYDVDTAADLMALERRNASTAFRGSRTMEYLRRHPGLTSPRQGGKKDA